MLRKKHFFLCFPCSVRMTFLKLTWPLRYKCSFLEGGEFACSCGAVHDSAPGHEISFSLRWERHFCICSFMLFISWDSKALTFSTPPLMRVMCFYTSLTKWWFHSLIITPPLSFSSSLSLYPQTPDQPTLSAHTGINFEANAEHRNKWSRHSGSANKKF